MLTRESILMKNKLKTNPSPISIVAALCIFGLLTSCSKNPADPATPPPPVDTIRNPPPTPPQSNYDSVWVMDYVNNTVSNGITRFQYDTIHKRYKGWSQTYTWYDSTFILYNDNGTVRSLVRKKSETPTFRVVASIYIYNSNRQVEKIYHKAFKDGGADGSFDYSYYTSLPVQDFHSNYSGYDSITYNSQGQISAIYYKQLVSSALPYSVFQSLHLEYPTGDSSVSKATINHYSSDNSIESTRQLYFTYNKFKNPYYILARQLCFLGGFNVFTEVSLVPVFEDARNANKILSISPYLCSDLNFRPSFQYKYNADSLPLKSAPNADFAEGVDFYYKKIRQ